MVVWENALTTWKIIGRRIAAKLSGQTGAADRCPVVEAASASILAFTKAERITMDVGIYDMANAADRPAGTLLSGVTYLLGGLALTLATAMVAASAPAAVPAASATRSRTGAQSVRAYPVVPEKTRPTIPAAE